jgi:alpha-tubulin suppressor-like RCC1 family protein
MSPIMLKIRNTRYFSALLLFVMMATDARSVAAAMLSAGGEHTCALRDEGRVVCWGSDAATGALPKTDHFIRLMYRYTAKRNAPHLYATIN